MKTRYWILAGLAAYSVASALVLRTCLPRLAARVPAGHSIRVERYPAARVGPENAFDQAGPTLSPAAHRRDPRRPDMRKAMPHS